MALLGGLPLNAARAQLEVGLDLFVVLSRGPEGQRGIVQIAEVAPRSGDGPLRVREVWRRGRWS